MPIKIFAFPTHCSKTTTPGVDYVRIIMPMEQLMKDPRFEITMYKNDRKKPYDWKDWQRIAQTHDILYINYLTLPWDFSLVGMLFRKYGKKIVFDIDDLIWEIQSDNSSYETYKPGSEGRAVVTDICNEADYVTVTNLYLKNALISHTKQTYNRVEVLPNRIDLNLYNWKPEPKEKQMIRICHFGSSSHFNDLANRNFVDGLERLMKEFPNVEFMTIGSMIGQFKRKFGMRYINDFGHQDLYTWVGMMKDKLKDVDIWAVPLEISTYNRSKSSIKFLEMSSTGKPMVAQKIRQYEEIVEDGKNGYLAHYADDWYKNLKRLVLSHDLRVKMGEEAYKTAEKWSIQNNIQQYADFFIKVMNSEAK